mmetsp:Transcript_15792/g.18778  ORF Transcript_15792/g.18778 Transcript_15792/m.18778 type:complete len:126 (+) Transcript_15792:628-1005(+)
MKIPLGIRATLKKKACMHGYWPVNIEDTGDYYFQLWRWPKESGKSLQEKNMFTYENAILKIGSEEYKSTSITKDDRFASFIVNLNSGSKNISAEFTNAKASKRCGAYYVYVTHMDSFLVENHIHN